MLTLAHAYMYMRIKFFMFTCKVMGVFCEASVAYVCMRLRAQKINPPSNSPLIEKVF